MALNDRDTFKVELLSGDDNDTRWCESADCWAFAVWHVFDAGSYCSRHVGLALAELAGIA